MAQIKYQIVKIKVKKANELVKFSADTDKKYKVLTGLFTSFPNNYEILATSIELKVANEEIFPEGFEVKLLTCGDSVSPNNRFYTKLECEAQGSRIEGKLLDGGYSKSYPYVANLYLQLEQKR